MSETVAAPDVSKVLSILKGVQAVAQSLDWTSLAASVDEMTAAYQKLLDDNAALGLKVDGLSGDKATMQGQLDSQQTQITNLGSANTALQQQITTMQTDETSFHTTAQAQLNDIAQKLSALSKKTLQRG